MRIFKLTLKLTLLAVPLAACTELTTLKQENPGQLDASGLYVPSNAQLLVNGVIADFECAYQRYVVGSAIFTDELTNAMSSSTNFDYDRRTLPTSAAYGTATCGNNQTPPIYSSLSIPRATGDTIFAKLQAWTDAEVPNRQKLMAQSQVYTGYSIILLGEGMCSAAINLGPEMTPAQLFAEAKKRFDNAVTAATAANDATTLNLALLGRARASLDLGDKAAAGVDAAKIPAGFVVNVSTNATAVRQQNFAFLSINQAKWASVDPSFRGLTINGAADPRVAVTNLNQPTTTGVPLWGADKYPALATTMPVARYAEAQLIVAESKLAANDIPGAVAAINAVRAAKSVPAYDASGQTAAQVLAQIVEERRRELFLEGHRLGDLRRYGLPILPAAGTPFLSGGTYGSQSCFPLPDVERINNPNIAG
jgi:starch-binding outer membrane protein, SusD/RagB family